MSHKFWVPAKSRADLENLASAWRHALKVPTACHAPEMVTLLENEMPVIFGDFSLQVKEDHLMEGGEGYTEFEPPRIVLPESTYDAASRFVGRARWTLAHELGHLVLHNAAVPLDRTSKGYSEPKALPSYHNAEWQADAFAAAFLMPDWLVRDFTSVSDIVEFFSVSRQAAEIRLKTLESRIPHILPPEVADKVKQWKGVAQNTKADP